MRRKIKLTDKDLQLRITKNDSAGSYEDIYLTDRPKCIYPSDLTQCPMPTDLKLCPTTTIEGCGGDTYYTECICNKPHTYTCNFTISQRDIMGCDKTYVDDCLIPYTKNTECNVCITYDCPDSIEQACESGGCAPTDYCAISGLCEDTIECDNVDTLYTDGLDCIKTAICASD